MRPLQKQHRIATKFGYAKTLWSSSGTIITRQHGRRSTVVSQSNGHGSRFLCTYGWSNLGNTQIALGDLANAEGSYAKAIELCFTIECPDAYLLYLNRGALRKKKAIPRMVSPISNKRRYSIRPDAILLQNLARADELNGWYKQADIDYSGAI